MFPSLSNAMLDLRCVQWASPVAQQQISLLGVLNGVVHVSWCNNRTSAGLNPYRRHLQRPATRHILNTCIEAGVGPDSGEKPSGAGSTGEGRWASGNPFAKPFPRARMWSPKDFSGLSGDRQPNGWNPRVEEEAALADKQNQMTAKELYVQLASAGPRWINHVISDMSSQGMLEGFKSRATEMEPMADRIMFLQKKECQEEDFLHGAATPACHDSHVRSCDRHKKVLFLLIIVRQIPSLTHFRPFWTNPFRKLTS